MSKLRLVPVNEMVDTVTVRRKAQTALVGTWARCRRGKVPSLSSPPTHGHKAQTALVEHMGPSSLRKGPSLFLCVCTMRLGKKHRRHMDSLVLRVLLVPLRPMQRLWVVGGVCWWM